MSKKRGKNTRQAGGDPEIARPNKQQGAFIRGLVLHVPSTAMAELRALFDQLLPYEKQLALVCAWRSKMWQIVESDDEKPANEARVALEMLFLNDVRRLLQLALSRNDTKTKQWAGMMLGRIGVSIWKHDDKLSKTHKAYFTEKEKFGKLRTDVLFPKPIAEAVQRELREADYYRRTLLVLVTVCRRLRAGGKNLWQSIANEQSIPQEYFGTVDLPEFSMESEPQWWKFLWPLIKTHNPNLLTTLRDGKILTRGLRYRARWASYRKEFRNAFRTLARLRSRGVL